MREVWRSTSGALAAVGATVASSRSSSPSRNGLPPVTRAQAAVNAASGSPSAPRDRAADRSGAEPARLEHLDRRVVGEVVEHRLPLPRLGRAGGGDEADREAVEPLREVGEPAQRGQVGPVDVVDEHQQRPLGGEVGRQPVEPVQRRAGVLLAAHAAQHRPRQRRRAAEVLVAHDRLEQLPHDREREIALELRPARAQHQPAVRQLPRRAEQPRLPDPRRPFDQQPTPAAAEHPPHGRDLAVPFLEPLHARNINVAWPPLSK